jgi:hypothetical protein
MQPSIRHALQSGLGDSRVTALRWVEDDFVVELAVPGNAGPLKIRFTEISQLQLSLDYGVFSGPPLLFEVSLQPAVESGWQVMFEFGGAPDGCISFECSDAIGEIDAEDDAASL